MPAVLAQGVGGVGGGGKSLQTPGRFRWQEQKKVTRVGRARMNPIGSRFLWKPNLFEIKRKFPAQLPIHGYKLGPIVVLRRGNWVCPYSMSYLLQRCCKNVEFGWELCPPPCAIPIVVSTTVVHTTIVSTLMQPGFTCCFRVLILS